MKDEKSRSAPRVLVVDDEIRAREALARALNLMGYQADAVASGAEALTALAAQPYNVMVLDLRMPGIDGVTVMNTARRHYPQLAVIILTAYATTESAIEAVRAGAVNYLLKPCSLREIEAAIAGALSRTTQSPPPPEPRSETNVAPTPPVTLIRCGPVTLNPVSRQALILDDDAEAPRTVALTEDETALMALLLRNPGQVFSCRALAREALAYQELTEIEARQIVRPHICRLRGKLALSNAPSRLIRTVRGKGYIFSPED